MEISIICLICRKIDAKRIFISTCLGNAVSFSGVQGCVPYTTARHCTAGWQAVTDLSATFIGVATMVKFAVLSVSNIGE